MAHDMPMSHGPRTVRDGAFHRACTSSALLLTFLLFTALPAAARSLVIESFDAHVRVEQDGGILLTETIRVHFEGRWNGLYRDIPVEYRTPQGFNKSLALDLGGATDDRGEALKVETSRVRHYRRFRIWVPGAENATRTIVLRYRIPNALLFFTDHDELYWNITGDEWEVPIRAATATVELPRGVTGVRTLAFTGGYGSREREAEVTVAGNIIRFAMQRELAFREGLTVVIGWDKGFVTEPGAAARAWLFLRSNWPLIMPLAVFVLMFELWRRRGRDPHREPVSVRYEPPAELSPAEVGTLADHQPDMRDITATIVDLAVRGHLVIEEKNESKLLGLWSSKEYVFERRSPPAAGGTSPDAAKLRPHEQAVLDGLFAAGERVELSDLENKFYRELPRIRDRIFVALVQRGYYRQRPDRVRKHTLVSVLVGSAVLAWAGITLTRGAGMAESTWIAAGVLSALIGSGFALVMPARTIRGARVQEEVIGFAEFLGRAERDRFERLARTPELFEAYLPFAMALGVERRWVAAFGDICNQPPAWYRGQDVSSFRASHFVNDMGRMTTRAAAVMASSPRGSGSSGFGGGGSSGGGGGGGGGGGF